MQIEKPYKVKLELYREWTNETNIFCYRGDQDVYPIEIQLTANGLPYVVPPETRSHVTFRRSDGTVEKGELQLTDRESGLLRYDIVGSELAVLGEITATVELQEGEKRLTWQPFRMRSGASADDTGAQPPAPYTEWTRDISAIIAALEKRLDHQETPGSGQDFSITPAQKQLVSNAVKENNTHLTPNTLTLAIATDTHALDVEDTGALDFQSYTRTLTNLYQINYASQVSAVDGLVLLGDTLNGQQAGTNVAMTKARALEMMTAFVGALKQNLPANTLVFPVVGNHDENSDVHRYVSYVTSKQEWMQNFWLPFADSRVLHDPQSESSSYYYSDFERQKIRCIFLDFIDYPWKVIDANGQLQYVGGNYSTDQTRNGLGFGARQVTWLCEEALNFSAKSNKSEWATLVFSHRSGSSGTDLIVNNGTLVMDILDAYNLKKAYTATNSNPDWGVSVNVDFSADETGGIIGLLQGHNHKDWTIPPHSSIGTASQLTNNWSFQITAFGAGKRSANGFSQLVTVDRASKLIYTTSICDDAALSSDYTRRRTIPIPTPSPPPLPPPPPPVIQLAQGSYTNRGVTVTITGTHIKLNGTTTALDYMLKITNSFATASTIGSYIPAAWKDQNLITVTTGDTYCTQMKNISGTITGVTNALGIPRVYFQDGSWVSAATATTNAPTPSEQPVPTTATRMAFLSLAIGATSTGLPTFVDYEFDLEVYLTGVRIV